MQNVFQKSSDIDSHYNPHVLYGKSFSSHLIIFQISHGFFVHILALHNLPLPSVGLLGLGKIQASMMQIRNFSSIYSSCFYRFK